MSSEHDDLGHSFPLHVLEEVDRLCDEFEAALLGGTPPAIHAYLDRIEPPYRAAAYRELLALELGRGDRPDRPPAEADYTERYPAYAAVTREVFAALHKQTGAAERVPEQIGKYRIVACLGSGGQGVVYRAIHPTLQRDVVIKISHRRFDAHPAALEQLIHEGKVLAALDHPNLVRIHDLDFHERRPFLVMDLVRGQNLRQYAGNAQMAPRLAASLVLQVAQALAVVHRHGVVHLDIKPENIIIDECGCPYLVDFGLATVLTWWTTEAGGEGAFRGTVAFASPEQAGATGLPADHRRDLFSLGAVLYCLLTSHPPYHDEDWANAFAKAQQCDFDRQTLPHAGVPRRLAAICLRAMSRDPNDRHATADELAGDLQRFLDASHRRTLGAVAGCLVAGLAAGALYLGSTWPAKKDLPVTRPEEAVAAPAQEPAASPPLAPSDRSPDGNPIPVWDRQARELRLQGAVIRKVKSLKVATSVVAVLDAFQAQAWPRRIPYPFDGKLDRQRLNDTVRSLNEGLEGIRFSVDGEAPGILWLPSAESKGDS